jgi:hypothetical protein
MKIIDFKESNTIFAKNQPAYLPLPAYRGEAPEYEVISCWELSDEEIETIKKTKKIWVSLLTFGNFLQPQFLTVNKAEVIKIDGPECSVINNI